MASQKILEQKQELVSNLIGKMQNAASGVIVSYQGITVSDDTKMRAELRQAGVEYHVYKNTMMGRACEAVGYGDLKQYLEGMNAIAICENDAVAPAKILKKYADNIETFKIRGGFVDGGVLDEAGVNALANIPSKDVLIAKFMGSLKSPLSGFAAVVQAIHDKKVEEEGAPAEA